jgi:hypothetical protein
MKPRLLKVFFIVIFTVVIVLPTAVPAQAAELTDKVSVYSQESELPAFSDFALSVSNGVSGIVRGVYAPGHFAFRVVQQSPGNYGYVSNTANAVTQFSLASDYGVTGLLAHNYLAGATFASLEVGQEIRIVYGDGRVAYYQVVIISRYRALDPLSVTSVFIDLATGVEYTAEQTFFQFYTGGNHVTLQTCIAKGNDTSWGRLFIVAYPIPAPLEPSALLQQSR